MGSGEPTILLTKRDRIAYITFNRPDKLNAMRGVDYELFDDVVNDCDRDDNIRAVIMTGKGRAFSAGDDMEWWNDAGALAKYDRDTFQRGGLNVTQRTNLTILESGKVWIAAVNGISWLPGPIYAADFVIAADAATFAEGDIRLGICPGSTETQTLVRLLGRRRALEIILLPEPISAQEAYRIGLVNKVVPLSQLMPEAEALAKKMAAYPAPAIKYAKMAVTMGQDAPIRQALHMESWYTYLTSKAGTAAAFGTEFLARREKEKPKRP